MPRAADHIYDELLVIRCGEGDEAAFSELIRRWQPRLLGYAIRLTGRPDVAPDVVQETWLAMIREFPRLEDPARFGGLAYRILSRRCADWGRRQGRQRRMADGLAVNSEGGAPAIAEQASDAFRVREMLDRLPSERRVVIALHYFYDLSVADIAATLRIPSGTVKSRLHKARQQLRSALEPRREKCHS